MRDRIRISAAVVVSVLAASLAFLAAAPCRANEPVVKDMSDVFSQGAPLSTVPGSPAVAETTIRHQIFFDDLEGSTAGWGTIDYRAGQPNAWHIVSGTHSCNGNAWWCGQTGLTFGDGYDNNWYQRLTTAVPINLAGTQTNKLTFKYRCQTEFSFDYVWVLMQGSNVGAKWDTLAGFTGNFGTSCNSATIAVKDSFTTVTQPVKLMFLFGSDLSVSTADSAGGYTGFSLDDVSITGKGNVVSFFDDMESGSGKWATSTPDPGTLWHLENAPGTSQPATCFFLTSNVFVPFAGSGFGQVPDGADAMLTSPPMNILGVFSPNTPTTALRLQFDNWINLPQNNSVYWTVWIQGSLDGITWSPWKYALPYRLVGTTPQCIEGSYLNFDPYYTTQTGILPGTPWIRLGFRIRDERAINDDPGPLRIGYNTEGIYFDDIGVYYVYTISGVETVAGIPDARLAIRKAFPNPFNPSTKIEFSNPKEAPVSVRVYDVQGRRVATLVDKTMSPGVYRVAWNGKTDQGAELGSGVYFAQVRSGASRETVRLTMLK